MGGANVDGDELHHWLRGGATRDGAPASLVVVGAQEAGSVGALEESVDAHLKDHARVDLDRTSAGRVGLCLLVYVARCEATRLVGAAKVDYANLGHLDRDPTAVFKGSLAARVAVDFCDGGAVFELAVAVAHLPAHEGKLLRRVEALGTLGARLAAEGGAFNGADAACFFGDLNFRLDPRLGADAVAAAADVARGGAPAPGGRPRSVKYSAADWRAIADYAHDAAALRPFDELRRVLDDVAARAPAPAARGVPPRIRARGWRDAPPAFSPTFKVRRRAGVDYVEKRLPAFTDRVLFAGALDLDVCLLSGGGAGRGLGVRAGVGADFSWSVAVDEDHPGDEDQGGVDDLWLEAVLESADATAATAAAADLRSRSCTWIARNIEQRFPTMRQLPGAGAGAAHASAAGGLHQSWAGAGVHELFLESPRHNASFGSCMSLAEVYGVLLLWTRRYRAIRDANHLPFAMIFKNSGEEAGATQQHPHSQLIGFPVVPSHTKTCLACARTFHEVNGACVYCRMARRLRAPSSDRASGRELVVYGNELFVAFCPWAPPCDLSLIHI